MFAACKAFYSGFNGSTWGTTQCCYEITSGCQNTTFVGCSAQNGALHGFDLQGCAYMTVTGCESDANSQGASVTTGVGINTNGVTNSTISSCTGLGTGGGAPQAYGIQVAGTQTGLWLIANSVYGTSGTFNYLSGYGYALFDASNIDLSGFPQVKLGTYLIVRQSVQTLTSTAAVVISSGKGSYSVSAAAAVTGITMPSSLLVDGEIVTLINESAFTITFAVAGTSHVAAGTSEVIAAATARSYIWDASTSLWYGGA